MARRSTTTSNEDAVPGPPDNDGPAAARAPKKAAGAKKTGGSGGGRKFTVSPTKLRMYLACAAKYRLEYVDKLGRFYHRARPGYAFGHSLHRALDAFHQSGGAETVTADDLSASLDQMWVGAGYQNADQESAYREEATRILHEYHAAAEAAQQAHAQAPDEVAPPPRLLFSEKTLRLDLSPEIVLTGRVDRVDEHHDGALEIVDYKSGREHVSEDDVRDSLALSIYQILLKSQFPDRRVFATLHALRTGASAGHELTDDERAELIPALRETAEEIRTRDWENVLPVVNEHCPYCDFLPHCEKFWRKQARGEQAGT